MGDREMWTEHAERVEMRGLCVTVNPNAGHRLNLRLGDMAVQSDIELAGEFRAA